jgi:hypothetical protein
MEQSESKAPQQEVVSYYAEKAADMLIVKKMNRVEVVSSLLKEGLQQEESEALVSALEVEIRDQKLSKANSDILWGAIWCVGGTVLTLAEIGFVFWGAIVFGGIQLLSGIYQRLTA